MAQVGVTVNGQTYQVSCDDGQEQHVETLAEYLDKQVSDLAATMGQVGEARLLLVAGLLTIDELSEAHSQIEALRAELEQASAAGKEVSGEALDAAEGVMTRAANRLEDIAASLEST